MRISRESIESLHGGWLLIGGRAVAALLLALGIGVAHSLDSGTLAGVFGMYAVMEGMLGAILWIRARRLSSAGVVAVISIATGLAAMFVSGNPFHLLTLIALRAMALGTVEGIYAQRLKPHPSWRWLMAASGVSAAIGIGFLGARLLSYDALTLRYCIVGYLGIVGALQLAFGLALRGKSQPYSTRAHA